MSLEYATEAAQEGNWEESQSWALLSIAEDLFALRMLLTELRPGLLAALPRVYTEAGPKNVVRPHE